MNTLKFIVMFSLNVTAGVHRPGAGMFARWTTASAPRSSPRAGLPVSVQVRAESNHAVQLAVPALVTATSVAATW